MEKRAAAVQELLEMDVDSCETTDAVDSSNEAESRQLRQDQQNFIRQMIAGLKTVSPAFARDVEKKYFVPAHSEALLIQRVAKGYIQRKKAQDMNIDMLLREQQQVLREMEKWYTREKEEVELYQEVDEYKSNRLYSRTLSFQKDAATQFIAHWLCWCVVNRRRKNREHQ